VKRIVAEEIFACWVEGYFGGNFCACCWVETLLGGQIFACWVERVFGGKICACWVERFVLGLAYQGKDIVFRFIIDYSSFMDFGP